MTKVFPRHWNVAVLVVAVGLGAQTRDKRITPVDSTQRQSFERQVKVALLVGIGSYDSTSGLGTLKYPSRDVDLLGIELERQGYLVRRLKDGGASRSLVRRALNELASTLDPQQGTFLFYFSGHGFQQDGKNYLATFGTTADDLKDEGLAVADVEKILKSGKARQTVRLIDACRSDPALGSRAVGARTFSALSASEGLRVLYSTRSGRVSYENDELKQGIFTYFLVRGLKGEAAAADGLVTFRDLSDYLFEQMRGYGVRTGQMQMPYEAGESSGDFLLAKATAPSAASNLPASPAAARTSEAGALYNDGVLREQAGQFGEAAALFRHASDMGNSSAMAELGKLYDQGLGVAQDSAQAMYWFRKSADAGDGVGMSNVGWLYLQGSGVPRNYVEAMRWFRKGADAGNGTAMANIGGLYLNGLGVPQDRSEAVRWFHKGADAGDGFAMNFLGWIYENGMGVPRNLSEAIRWYQRGADAGNDAAKKRLAELQR